MSERYTSFLKYSLSSICYHLYPTILNRFQPCCMDSNSNTWCKHIFLDYIFISIFSHTCAWWVVSNYVYQTPARQRYTKTKKRIAKCLFNPSRRRQHNSFFKSINGFDVLYARYFFFRSFWGTLLCVYSILLFHPVSIQRWRLTPYHSVSKQTFAVCVNISSRLSEFSVNRISVSAGCFIWIWWRGKIYKSFLLVCLSATYI